jgi:hypothetical protein
MTRNQGRNCQHRLARSYLLNLDRLARVETDERENRLAVLSDGRKLPVSRSGYVRLARGCESTVRAGPRRRRVIEQRRSNPAAL